MRCKAHELLKLCSKVQHEPFQLLGVFDDLGHGLNPRHGIGLRLSHLAEADAIISCVPTPLGTHLEPDLSYVEKTAEDIAKTLRKGQLVVLESTTYPRTTREIMLPKFEARGLKCGTDFFLAYSPEREDPGRKDFNTQTIPKLVGGIDPPSTEIAVRFPVRPISTTVRHGPPWAMEAPSSILAGS